METIHENDDELSTSSQQWRRYGEARRKVLVENDECSGGTSFRLNKKCRVDKYFLLAERVSFD